MRGYTFGKGKTGIPMAKSQDKNWIRKFSFSVENRVEEMSIIILVHFGIYLLLT
jgi:hypothetical protein